MPLQNYKQNKEQLTTDMNFNKTLNDKQHIISYSEQYLRFGSLSRGYHSVIHMMARKRNKSVTSISVTLEVNK
jgi:hypothetical protein